MDVSWFRKLFSASNKSPSGGDSAGVFSRVVEAVRVLSKNKELHEWGLWLLMACLTTWSMQALYKRLDPMFHQKEEAKRKAKDLIEHIETRHKRKICQLSDYEGMIAADLVAPEDIQVTFEQIGGLDDIKAKLQEALILPLQFPAMFQTCKLLSFPKGILLYGPPGTGKTMLAKAIAKTSRAAFINLSLPTVLQKWWGESEKMILATFSLARKLQPSIIFVDEIDCIFSKRTSHEYEMTARIKSLFMTLWDGMTTGNNQVTVIGATNRPGDLDEAIQRRLPQTFLIDLPNENQREAILRLILTGENLEQNFDFKKLSQETPGYSGSDLQALCQAAARAPLRECLAALQPRDLEQVQASELQLRRLQLQDFLQAKDIVGRTGQTANSYVSSRARQQSAQAVRAQPLFVQHNYTIHPSANWVEIDVPVTNPQ